MMNANLYGSDGSVKGTVELPASVFGVELNEALLHTVVNAYLANKRQGTAKTKGRSEVSGGGRKPFRQKGTGRARAGSNTSPLWVRGGKAHGTNPRDYRQGISKMVRRKALLVAYSVRASEENISILENIDFSEVKTSKMAEILGKVGVFGERTLLILPTDIPNVYLSSRNIKNVSVKVVADVNALDLLRTKNVLFYTEESIKNIEEVVGQ
jgi:large subunit ribosomal protein L4